MGDTYYKVKYPGIEIEMPTLYDAKQLVGMLHDAGHEDAFVLGGPSKEPLLTSERKPLGEIRAADNANPGQSEDEHEAEAVRSFTIDDTDDESAPILLSPVGDPIGQLKTGESLMVDCANTGKAVISDLAREGDLFVLGSDDKVGKTRTMHVNAYHVAAGKPFLDYPVPTPRDVCVVELDESENDTARTLRAALDLGLVTEEEVAGDGVTYAAFVNPDGSYGLVVSNRGESKQVNIQIAGKPAFVANLPADGVVSYLISF